MSRLWANLIAVLVLFAFAVPIGLSCLERARQASGRIKCASNIRQIGQAMRQYGIDDARGGAFARTTYDSDAPPVVFTGSDASDPFGPGGPGPNDVTAAYFLLLRHYELSPAVFRCEELDDVGWDYDGQAKLERSNFPSGRWVDFNFANPYPSRQAEADGFRWADRLGSTFMLAADTNHEEDGAFVLFADGSVRWETWDFYDGDDPWTNADGERESAPAAGADTVLLPIYADTTTAEKQAAKNAVSRRWFMTRIVLPACGFGLALILTTVLLANRARAKRVNAEG